MFLVVLRLNGIHVHGLWLCIFVLEIDSLITIGTGPCADLPVITHMAWHVALHCMEAGKKDD